MKVKELIKLTGSILNLDGFVNGKFFTQDATDDELAKQLLLCYNLSVSEIAQDYCLLYKSTTLTTKDGHIAYSSIASDTIASIKSVKTPNGSNLNFKCFSDYLLTEAGEVVITYSYLPQDCTDYQQDFNVFGLSITPRLMAYKMASEYSYINHLYEAANMWDSRFKDSIQSALRTQKNIKIKDRSFL